ncbi:hypothetical protein Ddye_020354 [Dipteronia dyeriana]|uniref:RING-type E3 ubiquitin transferase n=1 Tax=Dipteronia dyeriana TaxID=168575 RepID=A0AAD9TZI7_9ROSI|nr:hypothetical protein Ddye_020354 [Dipteronia dyeriana]
MASSEEGLRQQLEELQKQLGKKQRFEDSVSIINSLIRDRFPSASPPLRNLFYTVVCRVATILKTRYTAPGFWLAGLRLFELAESLISEPSQKQHLKVCITQTKEHLYEVDNLTEDSHTNNPTNRGYIFEGHLTVDPEPPQPQWLQQSYLMHAVASLVNAESSRGSAESDNTSATAASLLQDFMNNLDIVIPELLEDNAAPPRAPPASKAVVAKLPVIILTDDILSKLGHDAECAICKENLASGDKMQELPCKHTFHPPCLKPWLDEHNSCPICRHELQTDDHAYESWKEREKEAEEERKGAANAVRGGEYMYV